jgi:hypothetical protein
VVLDGVLMPSSRPRVAVRAFPALLVRTIATDPAVQGPINSRELDRGKDTHASVPKFDNDNDISFSLGILV